MLAEAGSSSSSGATWQGRQWSSSTHRRASTASRRLNSPPSISSATAPVRAGGATSSPSCVTSPRRSARAVSGPSWATKPAGADIARLGYLLERFGVRPQTAAPLHRWIGARPERWVPLVPGSRPGRRPRSAVAGRRRPVDRAGLMLPRSRSWPGGRTRRLGQRRRRRAGPPPHANSARRLRRHLSRTTSHSGVGQPSTGCTSRRPRDTPRTSTS